MSEILIVDDEPSIRSTLRAFLAGAGHSVEAVADSHDALQMVQERHFDLVLLDIVLGETNGTELMEEVRALSPRSRIVLMTGYPTVESLTHAIRFGVADYLFKPIDKESLLMSVKRALENFSPFAPARFVAA